MALKRRIEKTYSLEEMFFIINKEFINFHSKTGDPIAHYVISPTCFQDEDKVWLVYDSRYNVDNDDDNDIEDKLGVYYGKTIIEAVTKCFIDFRKNG